MRLIERINAAGTTVVMATHDRGIVDRLQKRVIVLSQGKIISDVRESGYVSVDKTDAFSEQPAQAPVVPNLWEEEAN
jgi:energy-coupling factor transporter ATP-binding protein EcfA2